MKISITDIKPHPINKEIYSLSNLDDLIKSIKDVGLLQPLIINQFNQIISGHRRFECVKKLGWDEVDVEIKNVDEVELAIKTYINTEEQKNYKIDKENKEIIIY